jgi:hypothetical protein
LIVVGAFVVGVVLAGLIVAVACTLELAAATVLLAALEMARTTVVRPTPVATTALIVVAVASVPEAAIVARTRTAVEIARRPSWSTLVVTREVASAATLIALIGPASCVEAVVRPRPATRIVA